MVPDLFGGFTLFSIVFFFLIMFALLAIGAGVVFIIYAAVRNARAIKASGHDPITLQSELAVKAMDSSLLSPETSIEERLSSTDDMFRRGVISEQEHAAARAAILAEG
jgi:hypothetical protein